MSRWRDQLANHSIHSVLAQLKSLVSREMGEPAANELEERRRFEKFLVTVENILARTDPELTSFRLLDSLADQLQQQVLPQVQAYANSGNVTNLKTANDQILNLNLTEMLPSILSVRAKGVIPRLSQEMAQQLAAFADALEKKQKSAEAAMQKLTEDIAAQRQELSQLEAKIEARKQETDAQLAQWQQQFSSAQEKRSDDYNAWRRGIDTQSRDEVTNIIESAKSAIEKKRKSYESIIGSYLEQAEQNSDSIRELYQLAAADSVTGGYVSNAEKEGKAASIWRCMSIGFIITACVWLLYSFFSRHGEFSWESALFSLPLTGVLLFGAAYCAQQSTRHRNVEVRNRRFALEMAAIDPYLQSLAPEDQQALKKELTQRFFGQRDQIDGSSVYDEHVAKHIIEYVGDKIIKPVADIAKFMK